MLKEKKVVVRREKRDRLTDLDIYLKKRGECRTCWSVTRRACFFNCKQSNERVGLLSPWHSLSVKLDPA